MRQYGILQPADRHVMSGASRERQIWKCPQCGRTYQIPTAVEPPKRCRDCESQSRQAAQQSITPPKTMTFRPNPRAQPPPETAVSKPVESSADESGQIAELRSDVNEILEHLRNISRTMTMMRRLMWCFVVISVLSAISAGYLIMDFKKSFHQVLQRGGHPQQQQPGQLDVQELLDALRFK